MFRANHKNSVAKNHWVSSSRRKHCLSQCSWCEYTFQKSFFYSLYSARYLSWKTEKLDFIIICAHMTEACLTAASNLLGRTMWNLLSLSTKLASVFINSNRKRSKTLRRFMSVPQRAKRSTRASLGFSAPYALARDEELAEVCRRKNTHGYTWIFKRLYSCAWTNSWSTTVNKGYSKGVASVIEII